MAKRGEGAPNRRGFATRAIHDGDWSEAVAEQPVSMPVWLTSDYLYKGLDHYADVINDRRPGFVYGRYGNPTHVALGRVLASLEGGEAAWPFASGMAAIYTALTALVQTGGHVVAQHTLYGGTFSLLTKTFAGYGIETTLADPEADAVAQAITPRTKCIFIEPLANPTFRVSDVEGVAMVCAERDVPLVVDNTVATPFLLRPLEVPGVTLVLHSTTKYINGHSDTIGGSVAGSKGLIDRIRSLAIEQGTGAGAFEAWLTLRGIQTLPLRMERQCSTAMALAEAMADHPSVEALGYSGLGAHPDHERAKLLFGGMGFGAMFAATIRGGYEAAARVGQALELARVGSSFGGLHTEVCHPATTSHRQLSAEERAAAGIGDGLLRIAVGGEDPDDLVADFLQALDQA
jgi:cystathionine beta-lyase/cystathionine gamma-synthase